MKVIGESLGHGLAPHNIENLTISGNYIGVGYDGTTILGNTNSNGAGSGIVLTHVDGATVRNNRIGGWRKGAISIGSANHDVTVSGNVIVR